MKKDYKKKDKDGYTLIETMIAIALFMIIMTTGVGALLNANLLQKKSQDMRSILDNLNFTMEDMSRNLRTGYDYRCIFSGDTDLITTTPRSCNINTIPTKGGGISFKSSLTGQWVYYIGINPNDSSKNSIFKIVNGVTVQLTPDEINIDAANSSFTVKGAEAPNPDGSGDHQQPFVTIKLVGTINLNNITSPSPFSLQTSVSQRQIDI